MVSIRLYDDDGGIRKKVSTQKVHPVKVSIVTPRWKQEI